MKGDEKMDRQTLMSLFQEGMTYSIGTHRLWVSKCFEITVEAQDVVHLDEYEGFFTEENLDSRKIKRPAPRKSDKMFHVSRSVLHLKEGKIIEEKGSGWQYSPPENFFRKKA